MPGSALEAEESHPVTVMVNAPEFSAEERAMVQQLLKKIGEGLYQQIQSPELPAPFVRDEVFSDINETKLFKFPTTEEAFSLGRDPSGRRVKLSAEQIVEMRNTGLIRVPSVLYPGQFYEFKVHPLIVAGTENMVLKLNQRTADGLYNLTVEVPGWLFGATNQEKYKQINIALGFRTIGLGLRGALSSVIGLIEKVPKFSRQDVDYKVGLQGTAKMLEGREQDGYSLPTDDTQIYYESEALSNAESILLKIVEDFQTPETKNLITQMAIDKSRDVEEVKYDLLRHRIFQRTTDLEAINPGMTMALLNRLEFMKITFEIEQEVASDIVKAQEGVTNYLKEKHPVMSLNKKWLAQKTQELMVPVLTRFKHLTNKLILDELKSRGLQIQAEIFTSMVNYLENEAPVLEKKLLDEEVPTKGTVYRRVIYHPKKWKIEQGTGVDSEGKTEVRYYPIKTLEARVDSDKQLWRLQGALERIRSVAKNGLYHIMWKNLINGSFGIKHIYKSAPFSNQKTVDPQTGQIIDDLDSMTQTLASRSKNLKNAVAARQEAFNQRDSWGPFDRDNRLVKDVFTFYNQNILGKGGQGFIWLGRPTLTATNALVSTVAAAGVVVWAPMTAVLELGFDSLIFDTKMRDVRMPYDRQIENRGRGIFGRSIQKSRGRSSNFFPLFDNIVTRGGLTGGALTVGGALGTIVSTVSGVVNVGGGRALYAADRVREEGVRALVMRDGYLYVPTSDDKVTRLVGGPGTASNYFFQIPNEVALLVLQARIEEMAIDAYKNGATQKIRAPIKNLKGRLSEILGEVVAIDMDKTLEKYPELNKATNDQLNILRENVAKRREFYQKVMGSNKSSWLSKVRLTRENLDKLILDSALLLQMQLPVVLERFQDQDKSGSLWSDKKLLQGDFMGLARQLLAESFSGDFLVPLEHLDEVIVYDVPKETLSSIFQDLQMPKAVNGIAVEVLTPIDTRSPDQVTSRSAMRINEDLVRTLKPQYRANLKNACIDLFSENKLVTK